MKDLIIDGHKFASRLFMGTGKFSSNDEMAAAIKASGTELVTVAMKRVDLDNDDDDMLRHVMLPGIKLLPNTSGVRDADEAVFAAQMSREAFGTNWLKLEIHPDPRYLLPDPVETLKATERLVKMGFVVFPYCQADPVLCKRLEEAGAATVMPLGASAMARPISRIRSSTRALRSWASGRIIRSVEGNDTPVKFVLVGKSEANALSAIAVADDPVMAARAFRMAVEAGRTAHEAGLVTNDIAINAAASSPLTSFLDK